jgi:hypothetical protein
MRRAAWIVLAAVAAAGLAVFVFLPHSTRQVVVVLGDCTPPPGGVTCSPARGVVLQGTGFPSLWIRAVLATIVITAAALTFYLVRRAQSRPARLPQMTARRW